jgi:3-deoxy-manno-octulosonate cytidylyltransferase (CMP-KDO synthetase)
LAIVAIIPARFASTRLPGKPLSEIHGKTMIERVCERARAAREVSRVVVATDDERIAAAVRGFGGEAAMTSPAHASGTDRVAEAARRIDAEIVVNVQGDEPMLDPGAVDAAVRALVDDPALPMATPSLPLRRADEMLSSSVVKVVVDARGDALYFSRSPIPSVRLGAATDPRASAEAAVAGGLARKHVGLYAYRREALLLFASLPPSPLEKAEGLEQLRALHHGMRIRVVPVDGEGGVAVDTPEDLERVRALLSRAAPGAGRLEP